MTLSTGRRGKMKPVKATKRDQFGHGRTFVTRRDDSGFVVFEVTVAYLPTQPTI